MTTNIKKIYHFSEKIQKVSELLINLFIKKLIGTMIIKEITALITVAISFVFINEFLVL
jgi:hypothetical protein